MRANCKTPRPGKTALFRLYCARIGLKDLDSARHTGSPPMHHRKGCESQIEAKHSDRRGPAPSGQGEEAAETREGPVDLLSAEQVQRLWRKPARRDRFGEVAASPNLSNLSARSIFASSLLNQPTRGCSRRENPGSKAATRKWPQNHRFFWRREFCNWLRQLNFFLLRGSAAK